MKMKEYSNYIFDLYGTLVDIHTDEYRNAFWKKNAEVFASFGADYEATELKESYFQLVGKLEEERKEEGRYIEIDLGEVFEDLYRKKDVRADRKVIEATAQKFREASTDHIRLYAGAVKLLEFLKMNHKKVFLLSNAQELFTMKELRDLDIYDLFDDICISSSYGYKKPDPVFFEQLIVKHDLKKEECLMIGNDMASDIGGAKKAGIDSFYIHSRLSPKKECAGDPTYSMEQMDLKKLYRMISESLLETESRN